MRAELRWINGVKPGRLTIGPRPLGGLYLPDQICRLRQGGVNVIVSLLEADEALRFELQNEAAVCALNQMQFLSFPVRDHAVPESLQKTAEFARKVNALLNAERSVLIHCFAGIGRSALLAACILLLRGMNVVDACEAISEARGLTVPETEEQLQWICKFKESLS
ncbi:MAG TPA: dual specificity protein phosphatase family protein [Planctomycetota bacterium]|nr:dual specificity protein phosphatase family protein [Planctomycetota bacterium]